MSKDEAIQALKDGKKLKHQYFSPGEWVRQFSPMVYEFEDGVRQHKEEFWNMRTAKTWNTEWELF